MKTAAKIGTPIIVSLVATVMIDMMIKGIQKIRVKIYIDFLWFSDF